VIKLSYRDVFSKNLIRIDELDAESLTSLISEKVLKMVNSKNWKIIMGLGRDYAVVPDVPVTKMDGTETNVDIAVNFGEAQYANKVNSIVLGGEWLQEDNLVVINLNNDKELYENQERLGSAGNLYTQILDTLRHELVHSKQHERTEQSIDPETDRVGYQSQMHEVQAFAPNIVRQIELMLKKHNSTIQEGSQIQTYIEDSLPDFYDLEEPARRHLLNLVYVQLDKDGYVGKGIV